MKRLKSLIIVLLFIVIPIFFMGCWIAEKAVDEANYESLSNEKGDVFVYSGGSLIKTYIDAKIIYSSADSEALWIRVNGKKIYIQGGTCIINLK